MRCNYSYNIFYILTVCVLFLASCKDNVTRTTAPDPRISFKNTRCDIGTVLQGETVKIAFDFKNQGDKTLVINKVTASCGCTRPSLALTQLKSGEKGVVSLDYDTTGKSGKVSNSVFLETNDPENPLIELVISANVVEKIFTTPRVLSLGRLYRGQSLSYQFQVKSVDDTAFEIVKMNFDSNDLDAFIKLSVNHDLNDGSRGYMVRLSAETESAVPKSFQDNLVLNIKMNDKFLKFKMPVLLDIAEPVICDPAKLIFTDNKPGHLNKKTISVSHYKGQPFKILKAESDNGNIKITISQSADNKKHLVSCELIPNKNYDRNIIKGDIILYTDLKTQPKVEVPVFIFMGKNHAPSPGSAQKNF